MRLKIGRLMMSNFYYFLLLAICINILVLECNKSEDEIKDLSKSVVEIKEMVKEK